VFLLVHTPATEQRMRASLRAPAQLRLRREAALSGAPSRRVLRVRFVGSYCGGCSPGDRSHSLI
jgi:hypothetical protein